MAKVLKEKYPYQRHPGGISTNDANSTYGYPIYWRYRNSVEQDFKYGQCSPWNDSKKLLVGKTTKERYWVRVRHTVQASPYGGQTTGGYDWIVYCDEIEWLYPEDMKELAA